MQAAYPKKKIIVEGKKASGEILPIQPVESLRLPQAKYALFKLLLFAQPTKQYARPLGRPDIVYASFSLQTFISGQRVSANLGYHL